MDLKQKNVVMNYGVVTIQGKNYQGTIARGIFRSGDLVFIATAGPLTCYFRSIDNAERWILAFGEHSVTPDEVFKLMSANEYQKLCNSIFEEEYGKEA